MDADCRSSRKAGRPLWAIMALAVAAPALFSQGVYRFKAYGPDQGLRNLATTCMAQDDDGYLWVGTEGGLFRYDGQRFRGFGTAEGLPDQVITDVRPMPRGLFVRTNTGPYRFEKGRFIAWTEADGVNPKGFACLLRRPGAVWMGSRMGLRRSDDGGLHFHPVPGAPTGATGTVIALAADASGAILGALRERGAHRETSLFRYRDGALGTQPLPEWIRKEVLDSILVDRRGRIWVRTLGHLGRMAGWGAPLEDLTPKLPGQPAQSGDGLALDQEGRVWAPTDSGTVCFDQDTLRVLGEKEGFPSPWANAIFLDREGSLWLAAEGVFRLQGRFLWTAHTRKQGLPVDTVWGIQRTRDGELWAVTPRGLARRAEGGWAVVPETRDRAMYAMAEDPAGGLWVGGMAKGDRPMAIFRREPGQSRFGEVPAASVKQDIIGALAADRDGSLWIGTQSTGLHRLRKNGRAYVCERVALPGEPEQATVNRVMTDRDGRVWAAGNHGLYVLEGSAWKHFGTAEGLKELNPSTLVLDPSGDLWVGYWTRHGLTRFAREGGAWKAVEQVDQPQELFQDDIVSMDRDPGGVFWFGTTQGVKMWRPKDGTFELFGRSQGLPGDDCTANALWIDANGDAWVGQSAGIAHFHAAFYHGPPRLPEARIGLVKDGSSRVMESGPAMTIPYRWRSLDFAFSSPSFLDEAHLRTQVRMAGFEDAWRDSQAREARYTTLPPGRYRFEVRFGDASGRFGAPAGQDIEILAPWWLKPWFLLLAALGVAGGVVLAIRRRTAMLLRRNEALEAQVRQRTNDLEAANRALNQANLALEEASMMDALTNLRNRRYLSLHMPEEEVRVLRVYRTFLAAAAGQGLPKGEDLVFLLVDLDHFKLVNDTYGHAAGDFVLKEAAEVLRKACRETDTVVRWGGEEFLVVARRTDRAAAEGIAAKIRATMGNHRFDLGGGILLQRTCSVGFAAFPILPGHPSAFHWESAVEIADQCLYAVKRSGRDGWVGVTCELVEEDMAWSPRLLTDLPGLAAEGKLVLRTSFPDPAALVWLN